MPNVSLINNMLRNCNNCNTKVFKYTTIIITSAILSACRSEVLLDMELQEIIEEQQLSGDPLNGITVPSIDDPIVQLGKKLFYTKSLGGEVDSACVTCHHPTLGAGDNLPLSVGVHSSDPDLLGPGRTLEDGGPPPVPRNALTVLNTALWQQSLFWDGRVELIQAATANNGAIINTPDGEIGPDANLNILHAQAAFPVTSSEEMRGDFQVGESNDELRTQLVNRLLGTPKEGDPALGINNWESEFRIAFNMPNEDKAEVITFDHIQLALSEFQRSMVFIDNPWQDYLAGNLRALTKQQKDGAILFYTSINDGGAGCGGCHRGALFSDERFHPLGFPQLGHGKGNGEADEYGNTNDFGRYRVTGIDTDMYKFRTPSLLNVEVTGPYGHAGSFDSLTDVIRFSTNAHANFEDYFGNARWCEIAMFAEQDNCAEMYPKAREFSQGALDARAEYEKIHTLSTNLTRIEIENIAAFLRSLTDPCVKDRDCMAPWIYEDDDANDPDENMLRAHNANLEPM